MQKPISKSAKRSFQRSVKKSAEQERKPVTEVFKSQRRKTQVLRIYVSILREINSSKFYLTQGTMATLAKRMLNFPYGIPERLANQTVQVHIERHLAKQFQLGPQLARALFFGKGWQGIAEQLIQTAGSKQAAIKMCNEIKIKIDQLIEQATNAKYDGKPVARKSYLGGSKNFTRHLFVNAVNKPFTRIQIAKMKIEEMKN